MKRLLALLLVLALMMPLCALAAEEKDEGGVLRTLKYGCRGEDVLEFQQLLHQYGYYNSKMDSYFGGDMKRAVENFQRANGLTADGKVGPKTYMIAFSGEAVTYDEYTKTWTLKYGSYGENVKELQRALRETFFYTGKIDGIFGTQVNEAVKAFQAACKLTVDGKVGKATKNALYQRAGYVFTGYPVRELKKGAHGWDVYVLQRKLEDLNYLSGYTAGTFDSDTKAGLMAFQKANGLKESGEYGSTTRRYLFPTAKDQDDIEEAISQGTVDDPYQPRTLKIGANGKDVSNLQMRLKAGGYLLGNADGIFGAETEKAVKALQKDVGIKVDGKVGPDTWMCVLAINITNAESEIVDPEKPGTSVGRGVKKLQRGSTGSDVVKLQNQLIELGFLPEGEADGIFGLKTKQAVKDFQKSVGIAQDGVAGAKTFTALNETLGIQWLLYEDE